MSGLTQSNGCAIADWITLDALIEDPLAVAQRLRDEGHRIVFAPVFGRYLVVGFDECRTMESDATCFGPLVRNNLVRRGLGPNMLTKVDPEHARERQAVNPSLRPKVVDDVLLPKFVSHAERFIADMIAQGPGVDFVTSFAIPFAASNLGAIVGLRDVPWTDIHRWSHSLIAAGANLADSSDVWQASRQANAEADAAIDREIERLEREPDHSMLSAMVNGPTDLSLDTIRSNIKLAVSGGVNEPQHTIVNGIWAFDNHPEQRDRLLQEPALFLAAFEEVVRWLSPIQSIPRVVLSETTVGGVVFEPGMEVMLLIGAANRDSGEFADADAFDVSRERRPHLAFGAGAHLCAGIWASRASVAKVAWPRLYDALPNLAPLHPESVRWRGFNFRGVTSMPVTWDVG